MPATKGKPNQKRCVIINFIITNSRGMSEITFPIINILLVIVLKGAAKTEQWFS